MAAVKQGWEVEERDVTQTGLFRREKWDRIIAIIPLWPRYIFDIQRITAPWFCRSHMIYGPVDGPYTMNDTFFNILKQMNIYTPSEWCKRQIQKSNVPVQGVIHHGIDPADFKFGRNPKYDRLKKLREKYPGKTIFFSNLNPLHRKGFPHLMKALNILQKTYPDQWIFILHTGLEKAVKLGLNVEKTPNLIVEDAYNQLPFRQIALKYKACDAYVNPSLLEGFGLPPLEASASGRSTVMCDCPAQNEILTDREAWYFPYEEIKPEKWEGPGCVAQLHQYNPESLAGAMAEVITNPEENLKKGRKAKLRARQYNYLKVYEPLVEMNF